MSDTLDRPLEVERIDKYNQLKAELEEAKLREQLYNLKLKEAQREKEIANQLTKEPTKAYSVEQDLKTYQNINSITVESVTEKPKTIGELKTIAKADLMKERQDFIEETLYGPNENRPFQSNARHYHETAFINIYENSSPKFKAIVGERIELLKKCDYWGLLELDIHDGVTQKQFFREIDKGGYQKSQAEMELQGLGKTIMFNNRRLV